MSALQSNRRARIEQLRVFLQSAGYCAEVQRHYPPIARRFLNYLANRERSVEAAKSSDLEGFIRRERRTYRKRHGRGPRNVRAWRTEHAAPARLLLRLVHGHWPRELSPASPRDEFHRALLDGYDGWMRELRGLSVSTRHGRVADAKRLLDALGNRSDRDSLKDLEVHDIDEYASARSAGLRRPSIKSMTGNLRIFLRYLHGIQATVRDLSSSVGSPTLYTYEGIPSALRPEDVRKTLALTRQDDTAAGVRDYAILQLLAAYGLRAGEVAALRLNDIDWKNDVLHVRHSKTGTHSCLPLLREPGEALLAYLERVRPSVALREVFLCQKAPHRPFKDGSSLYSTVRNRLDAANVATAGKKGPHAFRHARAVSLLRGAIPLKTIGDVLGHRSTVSTGAYLKLATEDLRAVALDIPMPVSP